MIKTNAFMSIHRIEKIEMGKVYILDSGTYLIHLNIFTDNNTCIEFSLFAEKEKYLKIIGNNK